MARNEEIVNPAGDEQSIFAKKKTATSKKVSDHLANERTFLAWIRTGLATMTFGFVVERFGLLLRELGLKGYSIVPWHASSAVGVSLAVFGTIVMIAALINFLHIRRSIDQEQFRPQAWFSIALTVLASVIGLFLVVYLLLTS
ncbi:YidH family protein [Ktedonosporobacter rubrisoli]|nr:DUF202 domain-containing protein [Ktedonosporobacter rubrisoli]